MKISFVQLTLVAALASFAEARERECTFGYNHCGHYLLALDGSYYSTIADEITRATSETCLNKTQVNNALFACGLDGTIRFRKFCKDSCIYTGVRRSDTCHGE
ncbi:hypothetical protein LB504_001390 [Fusarium proliferatum]|nr:hypothetical protein LB504_001390 [Fusarium proliferatum]